MSDEKKKISEKRKRLLLIEDYFRNNSAMTVRHLKELLETSSKIPKDNSVQDGLVAQVDALVVFTFDALPEGALSKDNSSVTVNQFLERYYAPYKGGEGLGGSISVTYQQMNSELKKSKSAAAKIIRDKWRDDYIAGITPSIQLDTKLTEVLKHIEAFAKSPKNKPAEDFMTFLTTLQNSNSPFTEGQIGMKNEKDKAAMEIISEAIKKSAKNKKCVIFTGAPGTGKTYCIEEFIKNEYVEQALGEKNEYAEEYSEEELIKEFEAKNGEHFVQFHSSYDYTDFVEGLRPIQEETEDKKKTMVFVRMDGIFKAFCREVVRLNGGKDDSEKMYYFVIDEINRADLGRVFGELMYCFEKRGMEHRIATQYANLPAYGKDGKRIESDCFGKSFYIPKNVVIIGTMNDIDRSVETFDFALRRRFDWVEIEADKVMRRSLISMLKKKAGEKTAIELADKIAPQIEAMNKIIGDKEQSGLGREFMIGPAYFKDYDFDKTPEENLDAIWKHNIEPILREYVRGRQNDGGFVKKCGKALGVKDEKSEESGEAASGLNPVSQTASEGEEG